MLDSAGIHYETVEYEVDEDDLSGTHAAEVSGIDSDLMFKTLVCRNEKGEFLVFVIPVNMELDLKKCARAAGSKSAAMIKMAELLPATGYMRGG
ncbi:MAG: Cys-tRNA(Pro) deacylase, partial [Firmicutes bacterium]|nr:Cys-tRNA(Pro) deacylase [Bacillota bacterium]